MANMAMMIGLHLLGLVLAILDFALWILMLGPIWMVIKLIMRPRNQTVQVGELDINGKDMPPSPVFRNAKTKDELQTTPHASCSTLYDLGERSAREYSDKPAQASRRFEKYVKLNEGDRFPAKLFGDVAYTTYAEMRDQTHAFGAGLRKLGMEPIPADGGNRLEDLSGPFKMLIFEETCAEWMIACQGAFSQSMVVFTAYATLGMDAVVSAVNEGEVTTMVCNFNALERVYERLEDMPTLQNIIFTTLFVEGHVSTPPPPSAGREVEVLPFAAVLKLGREHPHNAVPPRASDVAVVMYTSGSTGKPKGVIIRHSQVLGCVAGVLACLQSHLTEAQEVYLAYLPLAHILEMAAEFAMLSMGNTLCYAHPKDLSTGPGKCHPACGGALAVFKPTAMAGVPKIWEVLMKGAVQKIERGSPVLKFLFNLAMRLKGAAIRQGRYTPLFDLLVFKKFKAVVGGELKFTLSGGGPINAEVQNWIRTAFGCPMVQGYGLTESSGAVSVQSLSSVDLGLNGPPIGSVEVVLHSESDIKDRGGQPYLATDTRDAEGNKVMGRGEVWIRGTNIVEGYYKQPDKTAEEFDDMGFFHTGDIGQFTANGDLQIVDRKKNLVKLKGGEYIATEQMQTVYNTSQYVDAINGGVLAYGDGDMDRPVALVQVAEEPIRELAQKLGVQGDDLDALAKDEQINEAVKEDLLRAAKRQGLSKLEQVVAVALLATDPWTSENGCLTATNKLQPRAIKEHNEAELKELRSKASR